MSSTDMVPVDGNNEAPTAQGRSCGHCSLCCKLLHVIELNKPANKWCEHCRPGFGGCLIHAIRPQICRSYACGWLLSDKVGDEWFPLKSHMVLSLAVFNGIQTVTVTVDGRYAWIWKEEPYYSQLKRMASDGLRVRDSRDILLVHVRVDKRVWLMLPNEDVEITRGSYIVKLLGPREWGIEQFATPEQAEARMQELMHS